MKIKIIGRLINIDVLFDYRLVVASLHMLDRTICAHLIPVL